MSKNHEKFRRCTYQVFCGQEYIGSIVFQSGPVNHDWLVNRVRGEMLKVGVYDSAAVVKAYLESQGYRWVRKQVEVFNDD